MPLKIHTSYHVTHMLKDLPEATAIYQNVFDAPVVPAGYHVGENRDAAFQTVSDAYLELFAPRDARDANPTSNGGRQIKRFGEGLVNFGWLIDNEVPDVIKELEGKGLNLVYVAGGTSAFFVHPRQAFGIMLEVGKFHERHDDPRNDAKGWTGYWSENHPLGIERMNCVSFAVNDLDGAVGLIQMMTEAPLVHRGKSLGGREAAYLWCVDSMLELYQGTTEDSDIGRVVSHPGAKIESTTFKVKSVTAAAKHLRSRGVRVVGRETDGRVAVDPADMLGALYIFDERRIPGDPRDA